MPNRCPFVFPSFYSSIKQQSNGCSRYCMYIYLNLNVMKIQIDRRLHFCIDEQGIL